MGSGHRLAISVCSRSQEQAEWYARELARVHRLQGRKLLQRFEWLEFLQALERRKAGEHCYRALDEPDGVAVMITYDASFKPAQMCAVEAVDGKGATGRNEIRDGFALPEINR